MITININPVLFHIGGLSLRWYSLAVAAAMVVAVAMAVREGKKRGFRKDDIYNVAWWGIIAGIIGSRLFHVVDKLDYYIAHPAEIIAFQQGGLAIWGGVMGGVVAGAIYARVKGLPLARLADVAALALLSGQIVGRLGCIVNGDAYGGPTSLPWAFVYTHPNAMIPESLKGIGTHPYPVYEMLWNLTLLGLLLRFHFRLQREGAVFFLYLLAYSLARFLLTFVRQEAVWFLGLQEAQVLALLGMAGAALALGFLYRRKALPERA